MFGHRFALNGPNCPEEVDSRARSEARGQASLSLAAGEPAHLPFWCFAAPSATVATGGVASALFLPAALLFLWRPEERALNLPVQPWPGGDCTARHLSTGRGPGLRRRAVA